MKNEKFRGDVSVLVLLRRFTSFSVALEGIFQKPLDNNPRTSDFLWAIHYHWKHVTAGKENDSSLSHEDKVFYKKLSKKQKKLYF